MPSHRQDANLDLLRATAVLMVVVFHLLLSLRLVAGPLGWLMGLGRWAVLMFFVHTSLVLMFSLQRQTETAAAGWRHYLAFVLRRGFRLLPLSTVVIAAVVAFDLPVASVHHGRFGAAHPGVAGIVANVFLVQNLTGTDSVMGTLWSLPFEMQMYLVLPFAYLVAVRRDGRGYILGTWVITTLVSAATTRWLHHLDFLSFVPCFLPGVMAFALFQRPRTPRRWPWFSLALFGLSAIYVALRVEAVAWIGCLALGCAIALCQDMPAGRLWRVCHLVARYSYGIYLTHFILIWVFFVRLADWHIAVRWIGFWIAAAIVPVLLYHLVEEPMIRLGNHLARPILEGKVARPDAGALKGAADPPAPI